MDNIDVEDRPEERRERKRERKEVRERDQINADQDGSETVDIHSWLASLGTGPDVQITVYRKAPTTYKGVRIDGMLEKFNETVDEETLKDRHGGGLYYLLVQKRTPKGQMAYVTAKTLRISGDPKPVQNEAQDEGFFGSVKNGDAVGQAMGMAQHLLRQAQDDKREAERKASSATGMDPVLIQTVIRPLEAQVEAFQRQITELTRAMQAKDSQILDLVKDSSRPREDSFQNKMLEKAFDGESARVETLRAQHHSEIQQLKSQHQHDLDRERTRLEREIEAMEKRHARELDAVRDANRVASDAMKQSYETRIDGLKSEVSRNQAEFVQAKTEVAELRARKEKSLPEQAQEIVAIQEALKSLGVGGGDDDGKDRSMIEKIFDAAGSNPELINGILGKLGGKSEPGPSPEQQALMLQQVQAQQAEQHRQALIARRRAAIKRKRQQVAIDVPTPAGEVAAGAAPPADGQKSNGVPKLPKGVRRPSAEEVKAALAFMESAVGNGTDPAAFAATARAMVPADILKYIEKVGVDEFLNGADLPGESALRTQRGRNFAREVASHLLQGSAG